MEKFPLKSLFKSFPFKGIFRDWNKEKNFGTIMILTDVKFPEHKGLYFTHLSCRQIKNAPHGQLMNKKCLFAIGSTPKRRHELSAIKWILEENIDGEINEYSNERKKALGKWKPHQLISGIKASWYVNDVWQGEKPTKTLKDPILLKLFEKKPPTDPIEYLQWIKTYADSPLLLNSDQLKEKILGKKLDELLVKEFKFFSDYDYKKIKSFVDKTDTEYREKFDGLINHFCKQDFIDNAVALDIECNQNDDPDEKNLYQLGFVKRNQVHFIDFNSNSSPTRKKALAELESFAENNWIIGHNVINHDLKKLQIFKNDKDFLAKNPVLDTMLISMLLEPWKPTHALTSSERAHKADEDAKATQNLFRDQLEKIPINFVKQLQNSPSTQPAELLRELGKNLTNVADRKYPQIPDSLKKYTEFDSKIIIPEIMLSEVFWVPGVSYQWPDDYDSLNHVPLNHKSIENEILPKNQNCPFHILLLEILRDAEKNNVQVLKGMLPIFLQEKCKNLTQKIEDNLSLENKWTITTYEACLNMDEEYLKDFKEIFPALKIPTMVKELKRYADSEIAKIYESFNKEKINFYRLEECNGVKIKQFLGADFNKKHRYWIEYHPARTIKTVEQKRKETGWKLFGVNEFAPNEQQSSANTELTHLISLNWIDHENRLPVELLWPTTAKRFDYWRTVLEQLISLRDLLPDTLLILLVEHRNEIEPLTEVLADINILAKYNDTVPQSILAFRKNKEHFCSVSSLEDVPRWKKTATQLDVQICFIVTELPLGKWLMCMEETEQETFIPEEPILNDENQEIEEEEVEGVNLREELSVNNNNSRFSGELIDRCLDFFLFSWIKAYLGECKTVILDPRISILGLKRYGEIQDCERQILNKNQCQIFNQHKENFGFIQREALPSDYSEYEKFLQEYWGYSNFKETTQKPAIESIYKDKGNLLVKLPTGEGKSVIFQVPALLHGQRTNRLSFVITPLRALMRDQVNDLWSKGLTESVDYLSSDRDYWQNSEVYQGIIDNRIKLLYVSPERFRNSRFNSALQQRSLSDGGLEFAVIDETHCVSQWGFEFRPDYFFALSIVNGFCDNYENPVRMLLLSATVTDVVESDLRSQIKDSKELIIQPKIYKNPLQKHIEIHSEQDNETIYGSEDLPINRAEKIKDLIEGNKKLNPKNSILLIFVSRKKDAESITNHLQNSLPKINAEFNTDFFHAGLSAEERQNIYESVKSGKINILVATKAFGMGMDIPNIHWCIHFAPPSYVEDYLQEVGRTGRDEKKRKDAGWEEVKATLLYHQEDFSRNHRMVQENMINPPELISLWEKILENCFEEYGGSNICILSTDGFPGTENFGMKGDRLGKALSWFEREPSKRISIQGMIPDMLTLIEMNYSKLIECGKGKNNKGSVASAILKIYDITAEDSPKSTNGGIAEHDSKRSTKIHRNPTFSGESEHQSFRLTSFLNQFVGFLFKRKSFEVGIEQKGISTHTSEKETFVGRGNIGKAEIHIGSILTHSKLHHKDDIFRILWEMQQDGLFKIHREIKFESKRNSKNKEKSKIIWKAFNNLVDYLIPDEREFSNKQNSENFKKDFNLDEMKQIAAESVGQELEEYQVNNDTKSAARAAIKVLNISGLRIREVKNEKGAYSYKLAKRRLKRIQLRKDKIIHTAKEIEKKLTDLSPDPKLSLSVLLKLIVNSSNETKLGIWDLENALRLLSTLNLYHTKESLTGLSYVLEIKDITRLLKKEDLSVTEKDKEMYEQLDQVNRFAVLRSFSMELFTLLPSENRNVFIRDYFKAGVSQKSEDTKKEANPEDLEKLLENYVKKIEGDDTKGELGEILKKVQREAIKNEFKYLTKDQKEVCTMPYDQNLIVNAGPGSGKTLVLMLRTVHLIHVQGIKPDEILILAFNRAVVHEIRTRLRDLFDQLGYGGYVRSLQIQTFHAFALKNLPEVEKAELDPKNKMDLVLTKFCEHCKTNEEWTQNIVGGIQAILVDEFQGMNDDLYGLLQSLQKQSNAGITVIGDDDQDILRWNRKGVTAAVEAREYFEKFSIDFPSKDETPPKKINMVINFRSSKEIIQRSQNLLEKRLQNNRMKTEISIKPCKDAIKGVVDDKFVFGGNNISEYLKKIPKDETVAILCRTNSEVYNEFEKLKITFPNIEVLRSDRQKIFKLRHVYKFLDICQEEITIAGDRPLNNKKLYIKLIGRYKNSGIPEIKEPIHPKIDFLKEALISENQRASLQNFVNFLKETDSADYTRILGKTNSIRWKEKREEEGLGKILISTIHKVKGLEFDNVIILPSISKFPKHNSEKIDKKEMADEARLFYVAMTRAKKTLKFDIKDDFLNAWAKGRHFKGKEKDAFLGGTLDEVNISFPAKNQKTQKIIFEKVKVNDPITLQKTAQGIIVINHKEQKNIGRLAAKKATELDNHNLQEARIFVQSIIRYEIDEEKNKDYWDSYPKEIKDQKYFYTILISGLIPRPIDSLTKK